MTGLWAAWRRLVERRPALGWVERWGISIASLALGLATLFVFRRGLPHVGWIVGYVVLLWVLFAAVRLLGASLIERGRRQVVGAGEYAVQTLYHKLFLFVLPAYYASATLTSANAVFPSLLAGGAFLTAVDPWYRRMVRARPWLAEALLGLSTFAALNVALPLVGVRPIVALETGAVLSVVALLPSFRGRGRWAPALGRTALAAAIAAALAWWGRGLVPPAPLFMARAVAARTVEDMEPVDVIHGSVPAATVEDWGELTAYTAVYAPGGLRERIAHVWIEDGEVVARIPLSPIRGGRAQGFRTWSRRRDLRPPLAGRYRVDVVTASGQLIGRLSFTITPETASPPAADPARTPAHPL